MDQNTGALETTYPISVPPGRNGLQPDLDLVYNSQNSQPGSIFGEGWSISIPYIERLNKSGVENLYGSSTLNYFTSSLDGELVTTSTVTSTGVSYVARTENGTFNNYVFSSSSDDWTMTDKNGTQYVFGSTSSSQESDPNNASDTYKWMLKTVTDTNGNSISYNYFNDSGQIYPSSTVYTNTSSTTGIFSVNFLRASSTDNSTSTATGFAVNSNYRVSEIDVDVSSTWVRKYVLSYTTGDNGYTTLLHSIAESGENASGTVVSEPSSTFTYQVQTPGWTTSSTWKPPVAFVSSNGGDNGYRLADLTGNGLEDIISSSSAYINSTSSWVSSSTWDSPVSFTTSTGDGDSGYRIVDVNNNGLDDIVSCNGSYINTGSGWQSTSTWNTPVCFANNGVPTGAILADVNGDGLPTILYGSSSSTSATSSESFQVNTLSGGTLVNNLISYYPMEGDSNDFYGPNNGTDSSMSYGSTYGKVNQGGDFGGGSNIAIPDSSSTDPTAAMSVAFWYYPTGSNQTYSAPICKVQSGDVGGSIQWCVYDNGDVAGGLHTSVSSYSIDSGVTRSSLVGNWHFIAMTYDGSNLKLYIDNTLEKTVSASGTIITTSAGPLDIGSENGISQTHFNGYLDEVGFWGKVLSTNELTDLYDSGTGQTMVSRGGSSTLAAYVDTGSGWATSTVWAPPIPFVGSAGLDLGVRLADVTGDGLPDILSDYSNASGTSLSAVYMNTGNGWATSTAWTPPVPFASNAGWDSGARFADVNGDGLPDILVGSGSSTTSTAVFQVNTLSGGTLVNSLLDYYPMEGNSNDFYSSNNGSDTSMSYGTSYGKVNQGSYYNHSGVITLPATITQTSTLSVSCWFNWDGSANGGGDFIWSYEGRGASPWMAAGLWINGGVLTGTINGSGYATSFSPASSTWYNAVLTYNGTTLNVYVNGVSKLSTTVSAALSLAADSSTIGLDRPGSVQYFGGDIDEVGIWGKILSSNEISDLYNGGTGQTMVTQGTSSTLAAYMNTGSGWATSTVWAPPTVFDTGGGYDAGARIADTLGDGLPGILSGYTNAGGTNVYAAWTNNNNIRADILTGVDYPQGASTSIAYAPAAQFTNTSGTPVNTEPYPVYVVSKITTNDGLGNLSSSTYQYSGGTYYYGSPTDHEFAGFGLVTATDPAGNVTKTYYDTGNGTNTAEGQYNDSFWKIGKAYRVENYDNAGNLYKVVTTKWDSTSTGSNAAYVFPDSTLEMDYDGLSTHDDSAEAYTWNETNGNETQKIQWGQVTGSNNGTFTTSSTKSFSVNTLSSGTLMNSLLDYYPLEGNSNDYEASNNGSDTSMSYGTSYGKVNQGAYFSHSGVITLPAAITETSTLSVSVWFKWDGSSIGGGDYVWSYEGRGASPWMAMGLWINGGTPTVYMGGNGTQYALSATVASGTWYNVITTYDGTTLNAYLNGVSKLSTNVSSALPLAADSSTIGLDRPGSVQYFGGDIDEVGFWGKILSANEISDLYNGGTGQTMVASTTASDVYTTNITYASSTSSTVIGKVSDETLLNGSSTKIQETQYYYDGLALGSVGVGNLTTQDDWISSSTYATTTRNTYNSYGLVTQTLDPRNNTTTYAYDSYNLYPATTTNALSQTTGYQYDYSTGKPTQTIDPNGLKFKTTYDGLGRPLQISQPDQTTTSTQDLKTAYTYTDTAGAVSVEETDYLNGSTTVNTYSYYDGLDRLIQTRKSATDAGIYKVTDQSYNPVGLTAKESLPYFASGASSTAATTTTALFTTYTYDPLGRVLTAVNAVGTTTDAYDNWETKITDPNGNEKDEFHDAYGNLIQVGEHNGTSTYTTTYTYDGLQDLLGITDANGNVRSFSYDGLGREVSSTDLHGPASSTYGIWNYTYDNAGNLTKRVDPKNQSTTYTYDDLNRVLTESEASTTQITYTYDTCTNGVGRLCSVSSTDAVSLDTRTYDPEGNLASEAKTISGTSYTTSYTYDRQGNQLTITNPDSSEVEYTYGTGGLVTNVQEKPSGGSFANIVTSIDYSPMDQVATQSDANGITTTSTYNAAALYRLSSIVTTNGSSTAIQSSTYTYDNDGNITKIVDGSATNGAITVNYTYDGLNRLLTASSSGAASGTNYLETFTYDPVGNILSSPAGTYSYNGGSSYTDPDAVTKITNGTSTTFTYDNNGNLTNASSGFTYTWDYNNRMLTAHGAGATSTYGYDYTGKRALVTNGTSTTYYPEMTYNEIGTSTITKNIYANGELVATIQTGTSTVVSYVSDDYLGSTNAVTNASGTLTENISYLPYGQIRIDNSTSSFSSEPRKYIGQQYDSVTSLSYLNSRYYNGSQGQFLSEDPSFLAMGNPNKVRQITNQNQMALLANPQELNGYSYSQDNPIIKSDPSGNWYIDINVTTLIPTPFALGIGPTFGLQISQEGLYAYEGGATGLPPVGSMSLSLSTQNPSTGLSKGWSGCLVVCLGGTFDNGITEVGLGTPSGGVNAVNTIRLVNFEPAAYSIYPNQTRTSQSLQSANPITSARSSTSGTTSSASPTSSGSGSSESLSSQQVQNIQARISNIESEIQNIQREIDAL